MRSSLRREAMPNPLDTLLKQGEQELVDLVSLHLERFCGYGFTSRLHCDEMLNNLQLVKATCNSLRERLEQHIPFSKKVERCSSMTKACALFLQTTEKCVRAYRHLSDHSPSSDALLHRHATENALSFLVEKLDRVMDSLQELLVSEQEGEEEKSA